MERENSVMEEIIAETAGQYRKMPLLELLAEENMMTTFLIKRKLDPVRKRVQDILRSEIERRLR